MFPEQVAESNNRHGHMLLINSPIMILVCDNNCLFRHLFKQKSILLSRGQRLLVLFNGLVYNRPLKGGKRSPPFIELALHAGGQRFKSSTAHFYCLMIEC